MTNMTLREELKKEVGILMPNYTMHDAQVVKFNDRKLIGFTAVREDEHGGPTFWGDNWVVEAAEAGASSMELAQKIAASFLNIPSDIADVKKAAAKGSLPEISAEDLKRSVRPRLADLERNREFLADKAYTEVGGGFALYVVLELSHGGEATFGISLTKGALEAFDWPYSEEEILEMAKNNIEPQLVPLEAEVAFQSTPWLEIPNCLEHPEMFDPNNHANVLTSSDRQFGASALFAPGVKERLYEMVGGSYYIIPSSIHEVLIVPAHVVGDPKAQLDMVYEANRTVVNEEDVLSDRVLLFDGKSFKDIK